MITDEQVKAARELLGCTGKAAREAALVKRTLELFENGRGQLVSFYADVLRDVLKGAGVECAYGRPPRLRRSPPPRARP